MARVQEHVYSNQVQPERVMKNHTSPNIAPENKVYILVKIFNLTPYQI